MNGKASCRSYLSKRGDQVTTSARATPAVVILSILTASPAAAAPASMSPWVLMSAVASPASSRELCKERRDESDQERKERERDERCALPIAAAQGSEAGIAAFAGSRALESLPLITGLSMLAATTAYLLATDDKRGWLKLPISPS